MMNSYSPYTEKQEYCLIEGESGLFYPGVRIENISFPLSISALQAAAASCLGNGDRPVSLYVKGSASELEKWWVEELNVKMRQQLPDQPDLYNPIMPAGLDTSETLADLTRKSVTPHSGFPVSALLETDSGFIPGVNVEVGAWSLGLCAERTAIARAVTAGVIQHVKALHISAPKGDFSSPCGACRQVMAEFFPRIPVTLHHGNGTQSTHFVSDLLPFGFTGESLKRKK
jgi:homotetrameric cytidine deaminase